MRVPKKKYIKRPFPRKGVDWKKLRASKLISITNPVTESIKEQDGNVDRVGNERVKVGKPLPSNNYAK